MEGRMKKYRQISPDRAKLRTEKSPKRHRRPPACRKVAVVYYLCTNRQLEHPHFIEVPLSSPRGLYLRDVIDRLNIIRGRGMASMYSWSCKRSYRSGFVWHDLCEDDLILQSHGNEYILKGSEIIDESSSGRFAPAENIRKQNPKHLSEPAAISRSQDDSPSSGSMTVEEKEYFQDDELSPPVPHVDSSKASPECKVGKSISSSGSLSLTECKKYKSDGLADASTQTEENAIVSNKPRETCTRGVSTEDGSPEHEKNGAYQNQVLQVKEKSEICRDNNSLHPCSSSVSSSVGKSGTLESLIKADAGKLNSFRIHEEEEFQMPTHTKRKAFNMLMQLISCGSTSAKSYNFGFNPNYRPSYSCSKYISPFFSTSTIVGELDCLSENPRLMGLRLEDKEYFSGSLADITAPEEGVPALKRSSPYNADKNCEKCDSVADKEERTSTSSKCIPLSIKVPKSKHPKCESMRSPVSRGPRPSSDYVHSSRFTSTSTSSGGSKRTTDPFPGSKHPMGPDSFREEKENVITIEERLASGARVIFQSNAPCDCPELSDSLKATYSSSAKSC